MKFREGTRNGMGTLELEGCTWDFEEFGVDLDGMIIFMSCYVSSDRGFVVIALPGRRKEDRGREASSVGPFTGYTIYKVWSGRSC
tara:strand:+ start:287 stop:541 length:255 start_codon:yes stop_codon:yes gene_type:complete